MKKCYPVLVAFFNCVFHEHVRLNWLSAGILLCLIAQSFLWAAPVPSSHKAVSSAGSSSIQKYPASNAIDGTISDASRWVSEPFERAAWLEINLGTVVQLSGLHLYSGYGSADPVEDFTVQFMDQGTWRDIPSAKITNNTAVALLIPFDDTLAVKTDKIRLWITRSHQNVARIKEVVIWPASVGSVPPLKESPVSRTGPIVPLYLNQSGFNLGKPKRFTAPKLPDGTPFAVFELNGTQPLFSGTLSGQIGDFSAFNPNSRSQYVVRAGGLESVPFRVGNWWLERVTYQNAVDFMIDSRHYVGNDRAVCQGSFGWRDDHHFGWELHTLVPQYLSNPSAYDRMPRQIRYEKPANPKLWGALEPYSEDAPDIIKLIHWGADVIVTQGLTHEMLKSQLAYFLYAWPVLKPYLPEQNYSAVSKFAFTHWTDTGCDRSYPYDESPEHNLLALKTRLGSTKGAYPPGFSIQPNLLLYEVAKQQGRSDAELYMLGAVVQAEWLIQHLDWNDPQSTKGQRMSEFLTITGLAHLLREYPDRAPAGLKAKIEQWAKVVIRRSENMWDFRKLDDGDKWTPMGEKATMWNEPGNVVGLPAALLAASEIVDSTETKHRLEELVWSHFDNMFGRNPVGRHFSFDAPREIEGVEYGWFRFYPGGIGRLAEARFVIDGSPKDGHYPYHPEKGDFGWTEGWIQFNTPFNNSLAWLAYCETRISITRQGSVLQIQLEAPLNFEDEKVEFGKVRISSDTGDMEWVQVTEISPNSRVLAGKIAVQLNTSTVSNDGVLQADSGSIVKAAYGYGYMGRSSSLRLR
jgi:hypothetical protein